MQVAECYSTGRGCDKDDERAFFWYGKAAAKGHPEAQVGAICVQPQGCLKSLGKLGESAPNARQKIRVLGCAKLCPPPITLFSMCEPAKFDAAVLNSRPPAHRRVGLALVSFSCGVPYCNYPQTELAWRYAQGKGCRVDQVKATEWFEKSAGQGYPEAMFVLGWRKINGEGTSVNEAKGIELYMRAAARGVSQAQYNMALRFEEGKGVPKDDGKALKYYTQVGPCRSYTPIPLAPLVDPLQADLRRILNLSRASLPRAVDAGST